MRHQDTGNKRGRQFKSRIIVIALILVWCCNIFRAYPEKVELLDCNDLSISYEDYGYYYKDSVKYVSSEIFYHSDTRDFLLWFPPEYGINLRKGLSILTLLYEDDNVMVDPEIMEKLPDLTFFLSKYVAKGDTFSAMVLHPDTIPTEDIVWSIVIKLGNKIMLESGKSKVIYKGSKIILEY